MSSTKATNVLLLTIAVLLAAHLLHALIPSAQAQNRRPSSEVGFSTPFHLCPFS